MYCKNCGAQIDANARFCPECGFEQGPGASYAPPGQQQYQGSSGPDYSKAFDGYGSKEQDKHMMLVSFLIALVLSILLGLIWALVIGIILLILYVVLKKDVGAVRGAVIGGVIGLVVGYLINLLILGVLIASIY